MISPETSCTSIQVNAVKALDKKKCAGVLNAISCMSVCMYVYIYLPLCTYIVRAYELVWEKLAVSLQAVMLTVSWCCSSQWQDK